MITAQRAVSRVSAALEPGEDDLTVRNQNLAALMSAIPRLSRLERQVLTLRIIEETRPVDIARYVGCTEMQVFRLLRGAALNLRAQFDRELAEKSKPWA